MTTTVKVEAHCSDNVQVEVRLQGRYSPEDVEITTLQDGEEWQDTVHGDVNVNVKEVPKNG